MSRAAPKDGALAVEIDAQSPLWEREPDAADTVRGAVAAAAAGFAPATGEVSILLTDDAGVRELNRQWRGIDKPTNVLSFPAAATPQHALLGDIVIAYETLARESQEQGTPFLHHLAHLTVHGFLHLLGYDHETDSQAEAMEGLERDILASLAIADPYRVHETGNA